MMETGPTDRRSSMDSPQAGQVASVTEVVPQQLWWERSNGLEYGYLHEVRGIQPG